MDVLKSTHDLIEPKEHATTLSSRPNIEIQFGSFGYQKKAEETVTESVTRSEDGSGLVVKKAPVPDIKIQFGTFGNHHHKRTPIENTTTGNTTGGVKVTSLEVEPGNINITETILSILQEKKGEEVMMTCEGVDNMDDNYMVKIPRFEDEKLGEQIKNAELQHDDNRRCRDEIAAEIQMKRANMRGQNESFKAANLDIKAARQLVKSKEHEIDHVQGVLKKVNTALSVKDIHSKIYKLNHMIEPLKDEEQFIQEIRELKGMSDQLASHIGNQNEIQQAVDQKDQLEELMTGLKNDLKILKEEVSKTEEAAKAIEKEYNKELETEKELRARFIAAEESREKAYGKLNNLKKDLYDKNKTFHMYEEEVKAARRFAACGDKASLHYLCANQVERFIEKWNTDEEFRKDYTNMHADTLDGPLCVFPNDTSQKIASNSVPISSEIENTVSSFEEKLADDQTKEKVAAGENEQMMKTEGSTEKVQTPADMKAEKEALRKEKARLKRLRKKERKRAAGDAASSSRVSSGDVAESKENRNEELQQALQPCFLSKHVKPETILMAVAIQDKRRWRLWTNVVIVVVLILSVFSLH